MSDPNTHAPRISPARAYGLAKPVLAAITDLSAAVKACGLENSLLELVKLRASQINGCAYCVQMHAVDARKEGETEDRLQLLAVWPEAPVFTPRERAALAWTEALTRLSTGPVSDALYAEVSANFSEAEIVNLTAAVGLINMYNRFGAPLRYPPAVSKVAA
ncbi:carboxymuconolactone decarboxylase family protein [Roseixanthobacter liquoris]|uniref:carboxymuconolactone decarboxylase family protein n=1 Tax=Roseixanthobacter liquoris TaxID=3119921 RepID=UPI003729AC18